MQWAPERGGLWIYTEEVVGAEQACDDSCVNYKTYHCLILSEHPESLHHSLLISLKP